MSKQVDEGSLIALKPNEAIIVESKEPLINGADGALVE
jgi:hypothetical protein